MNKNTGIYIHIPFCKSKCKYCDFLSFSDCHNYEEYFDSLKNEIIQTSKMPASNNRIIKSIFFGGGTPSLPDSKYICDILDTIRTHYNIEETAEITIECNPGTLTPIKLKDYYNSGINRISIGLQSANNKSLKFIGRIHTYEEFLKNYSLVWETGFSNINIDIMSALPYESVNEYLSSLERIINLNPSHISAYSLILEENTPLFNIVEKGLANGDNILPDEDDERKMYELTKEMLISSGYNHYEISNYAKKGYECYHNSLYWRRGEYFGFGLGASSFINEQRYKNTDILSEYLENSSLPDSLYREITKLSKEDAMSEFMYLGLRFIDGINSQDFFKFFGHNILEIFGDEIKKLISLGLLTETKSGYKLTSYGVDISNYALSFFV